MLHCTAPHRNRIPKHKNNASASGPRNIAGRYGKSTPRYGVSLTLKGRRQRRCTYGCGLSIALEAPVRSGLSVVSVGHPQHPHLYREFPYAESRRKGGGGGRVGKVRSNHIAQIRKGGCVAAQDNY